MKISTVGHAILKGLYALLLLWLVYLVGNFIYEHHPYFNSAQKRGDRYVKWFDEKGTCQVSPCEDGRCVALTISKYYPVVSKEDPLNNTPRIAEFLRYEVLKDSARHFSSFQVNFDSTDQGAISYMFINMATDSARMLTINRP